MESDDDLQTCFSAAADYLAGAVTSGSELFNDKLKLQFYGLYKQATVGRCADRQPGFWNPAGRAKWDAWSKLEDMPSDEAMERYIELLAATVPDWNDSSSAAGGSSTKKNDNQGFGPVFSMPANLEDGNHTHSPEVVLHVLFFIGYAKAEALDIAAACTSTIPLFVLSRLSFQGTTPTMHELAGAGDDCGVNKLLEAGTDVNTLDEDGCTALHFAADRGQASTAGLLISAGAKLNAQDSDGASPLHYAAMCGNKEVAVLLLEAGADSRLQDSSGNTAKDIASVAWDIWPS